MRICLVSNASVYTDAVLHSLLAYPEFEIAALVKCTAVTGTANDWPAYRRLLARSGILYAGYLGAVTKPRYRLPHLPNWRSMRVWSHSLSRPVLPTTDVSAPDTLNFIEHSQPDIILTAHLGQILRPAFYERFAGKTVNIHPGKLPVFKGPDPVFHGLLEKEKSFSVSLHESILEIDAGKVLAEKTISLKRRSLFRTNLELFRSAGELMASHFLGKNDCQPFADERPAAYHSWPTNGEVLKFLARGNRL
ncbi:formyltransferase family protein [Pseudovibrio sp. Tun.PSC04-5.I4]|uniref:formyltransferase family protein n=1 Tax=Pseudovibrio sp. Tun.PSC04-5.I4 TaxID=1798213 RepID=UPI000885C21B|nr:formyltransferase family protein [Pseudovibrio sp. Tun.PSC04-5.I4]SDQ22246.1 Formyl transferase [Pseudovibrio sp. Tun.PSC04-5.I4]